jgi:shikimate 5-dehydrogenase
MQMNEEAVFALIGNPVAHSCSPLMHNFAYEELKFQARYVAFRVTDLENALRGIRALQIGGVSITIPFKVEVMKYLDEVDEEARKIGAVNTIIPIGGLLSVRCRRSWISRAGASPFWAPAERLRPPSMRLLRRAVAR